MASTAESVCELVDTFASSLLELRRAPAIRADVDAAFGNCAGLKEDMEERRVLSQACQRQIEIKLGTFSPPLHVRQLIVTPAVMNRQEA
ncbi:unnamed protein product [Fusarium graminearum]|uniref:Chromosome 2, complete genome n=1 Tax=Gibberella zeae (strain ATCC MYA-4620 / CBS 123657 / FGSC 9075 / NRRL 31084 / PH-1) TaxID=229533 RepID=A0A098DGX3_GIBZE|nr:unnamed protein product [Fusarium graminearum]